MEVAERAMKILPRLKKFVKEVSFSSVSFDIVKSSLIDNPLEVKLTFFYSLASELELFLTIFQSEIPMAPFLHDSLEDILLALYAIAMSSRNEKLPGKAVMLLKGDVRRCLRVIVIMLQDKSPLKYKLTKRISYSCLRNWWLSGPEADIIEQTCELVCSSKDSKALISSFSRVGRLDRLWFHILKALGRPVVGRRKEALQTKKQETEEADKRKVEKEEFKRKSKMYRRKRLECWS
ncbi:hypothetical protein PR048_027399 [Dryococelus australis]|uniref:Uncharacterized protein n=1 Tax=Dryococelus australis TaxID=614101 RepID=A0ABQ9GFC7_9NEOP|nr:hypothetical protein PR048_027399 [Dryococelus australis]